MPAPDITILPVPMPCAVCGRPTTQFSSRIEAPYCGRDGALEPHRLGEPDGFGPPQRSRRAFPRRTRRRPSAV